MLIQAILLRLFWMKREYCQWSVRAPARHTRGFEKNKQAALSGLPASLVVGVEAFYLMHWEGFEYVRPDYGI